MVLSSEKNSGCADERCPFAAPTNRALSRSAPPPPAPIALLAPAWENSAPAQRTTGQLPQSDLYMCPITPGAHRLACPRLGTCPGQETIRANSHFAASSRRKESSLCKPTSCSEVYKATSCSFCKVTWCCLQRRILAAPTNGALSRAAPPPPTRAASAPAWQGKAPAPRTIRVRKGVSESGV